jgi:leader peptidase (prepilin peptidase)/N-methyltransferase
MMELMPMWFMLLGLGLFGAVLGSFLNVCIYRVPRNLSVVSPPSSCPGCGDRIAPYDNVPVLGWLWLRGRCRSCRAPISKRYPGVELLTAVLFALLALRYGLTWELVPALYFAAAMVVVTLIDFDARIIPDAITFSGVPLGLLSTLVTPVTLVDGLIGAAAGFAFLYAVAWGYQKSTGVDGLGGGDIKFAAMLGAFLGWQGVLLTVFAASFVGSVAGGVLMAVQKGGRRTALPFGTFLAPVGLAVYLWGGALINWYLGRFPQ